MVVCTSDDVYRIVGLSNTVISSDDVNEFILDATDEIENELSVKFEETTITDEYHDGNGKSIIYPRYYPIISVTSLYVNDSLVSPSDIVVYGTAKEGGFISFTRGSGNFFYIGQRNVKITYKTGYETIPRIAKKAVSERAAIMTLIHQLGGTYDDITSYSIGDTTISKGEPSANIQKTMQNLNGLVGKEGQHQATMRALKKKLGSRYINYRPHWGWI